MKMTVETKLESSAEQAWSVLGDGFGRIAEWSCGLAESSLDGELAVGAVKTCVSSDSFGPFQAGVVEERLTEFDPDSRTFAYRAISGLPGFIETAGNRWSIHAVDDDNCIVRFDATVKAKGVLRIFEPVLGPLMKLMMRSDMKKLTEEMQYRVAHGKLHPRKTQVRVASP